MSSMDIDMPLEDVIKKDRAQKKGGKNRMPNKRGGKKQQQESRPTPVQSTQRGGKIGKGYTSRPGNGPAAAKRSSFFNGNNTKSRAVFPASKRGGITTASLRSRVQKSQLLADPASIIITKNVTPRQPAAAPSKRAAAKPIVSPSPQGSQSRQETHRIRGISSGITIRGESGSTIVLVRNLDPGANAEDVRTAFLSFGEVLRCDLAYDHTGLSLGEAEVEFANRAAAIQAVQQLDGEIADGRVLKLTLRDKVASPRPARGLFEHSVRSMISPARNEGRLYADHMDSQRSSIFARR